MRFYADRELRIAPRSAAEALRERLRLAAAAAPGPARHGALGALLVSAGELTQGIADAECAARGADDLGGGERSAAAVTLALARALWASWRTGGAGAAPPTSALDSLLGAPLPEAVTVRRAEGFALYGLYPETFAAAATALAVAPSVVVGVRSIGPALAAMVAAGAGGGAGPTVSVRPIGHPFGRRLLLGPGLSRRLAAAARGHVAVADEGPGLSGSSFLAVADAASALGVPLDRLHLFPSHAGAPGAAAPAERRARYELLARHHVPFEALFLSDAPLALGRLVEDLVGPIDGPPADLSAGAWRAVLFGGAGAWPPSEGWRERRKYLFHASGRPWLARFAGLGDAGERALSRARDLARVDLAPAPVGLRHGFLVETFEDARPLPLARVPRPRVLEAVRRHVTHLAARFPAAEEEGAAPRELAEVAVEGARELLGAEVAAAVAGAMARLLPEVQRLARPVAVDGRLQRWEWLVRRDGKIVKADALDHHADHGLVGCQDALWDVAGATLELGLAAAEAPSLAAAVRGVSPGAPPRCLRFYLLAYAAFEAGRWAAAAAEPGTDPSEAARRRLEAARLADALRRAAGAAAFEGPGTRGTLHVP